MLDSFQSSEIKRSSFFDEKIGFPTWNQGLNSLKSFYPNKEGIRQWIDAFVSQLSASGVELIASDQVESFEFEGNQIIRVKLQSEAKFEIEHAYWTGPMKPLVDLLGAEVAGVKKPDFRTIHLLNLELSKPFLADSYYIYHHDASNPIFRSTFYPNLRKDGRNEAPFTCTVELAGEIDVESVTGVVLKEFEDVGIVEKGTQVLDSFFSSISRGFPIPKIGTLADERRMYDACRNAAANLTLYGRGGGNKHFIHEIVEDVWHDIMEVEDTCLSGSAVA
jgi:protoporphyrinogen oxidase